MEYAFDYVAVRSGSVRKLADDVANLERERDELKQQLSIASTAFTEQLHRVNFVTNAQVNEIALDRDAWKAKAERTCKWTFTRRSQITGRCNSECGSKDAMVWLYDPQFGYVFCPFCGGRIVKEEE